MEVKKRDSPENSNVCALPVKKKRFRLKSARDCTSLLQQVVNGVWNNEIACDKARVVIYAASTLVKAFEVTDLEERLAVLEERLR
jgi:hypothetical protein